MSLLLEQVLDVGEHVAASLYSSGDATYKTMHGHLTEYLFYYLRKLSMNVFALSTPFLTSIKKAPNGVTRHDSFWENLSMVTGPSALQRPPKAQ